jgi:hypothetical protein
VRLNPRTSLGYGWSLLSLPFTFTLYLSGSSLLDNVLVQVLGFNRSSGDAFGPFVTLLGLIYSILLGQIYEYYFNRQGIIQDALYQEVSALGLLSEVTGFLAARCVLPPFRVRVRVWVRVGVRVRVRVGVGVRVRVRVELGLGSGLGLGLGLGLGPSVLCRCTPASTPLTLQARPDLNPNPNPAGD